MILGAACAAEEDPNLLHRSKLVPANYAMQILRGLVLRGATVAELAEPIVWLTLYTVVIIGIAVFRFKKTAE